VTLASDIQDLRYPIGPRVRRAVFSDESRAAVIASIEQLPADMRRAVAGLADAHLDTPYRPGGWTVRQVVHHVADAHMVVNTRARIALTEDNPPVKMWDHATWAELSDAKSMPIDDSLAILDAAHRRLVHLLRTLAADQWRRTMTHPEWGVVSIDDLIELCAWHGEHHTAHVTQLRKRSGW
jgi:DinB superfamily